MKLYLRVWVLKGASANTSVCSPEFDCVVVASSCQDDLRSGAYISISISINTNTNTNTNTNINIKININGNINGNVNVNINMVVVTRC